MIDRRADKQKCGDPNGKTKTRDEILFMTVILGPDSQKKKSGRHTDR